MMRHKSAAHVNGVSLNHLDWGGDGPVLVIDPRPATSSARASSPAGIMVRSGTVLHKGLATVRK